ncbi:hypothetical protein [Veronia pacifica]|uniref:Uncharacterized protein n=1 Tax=Veronia pacifica TaxID=1080227 RepID=A0A1C3ER02_9GAMM|nr:hypothetical protein [Veronia pacifica]ODA35661.1 hypothetical protein A8L45_03340 [Veronia pacifica]
MITQRNDNVEDLREREFIRSLVEAAQMSGHHNRVSFDMIRLGENVVITAQDHYPIVEIFAIYENPPEGMVEKKLVQRFEDPTRFGRYFIGKDKNKNVLVFERVSVENMDEFSVFKSIRNLRSFISD